MTNRRKVESIADAFVTECQDDFVGLWAILWEIKRTFPDYDATKARSTTIDVVRLMLDSDRVVIGDFDQEKHFVPWPLRRGDAVQRLEAAWDTLEREPDIGDIGWFAPADHRSK